MTPFKFLTYLLLGATTVTAESFAVEPSRPHRLKRRSFEDCVKAMVADVWAGPTRPPNARTAVCYSGHFRIRDMNVYVFDFDSNRECVEKQGLIKEKNRYECFFIKGSNIFTAVDDAGSKNMAYIASDKCTWDHDNKTLTCD